MAKTAARIAKNTPESRSRIEGRCMSYREGSIMDQLEDDDTTGDHDELGV